MKRMEKEKEGFFELCSFLRNECKIKIFYEKKRKANSWVVKLLNQFKKLIYFDLKIEKLKNKVCENLEKQTT